MLLPDLVKARVTIIELNMDLKEIQCSALPSIFYTCICGRLQSDEHDRCCSIAESTATDTETIALLYLELQFQIFYADVHDEFFGACLSQLLLNFQ